MWSIKWHWFMPWTSSSLSPSKLYKGSCKCKTKARHYRSGMCDKHKEFYLQENNLTHPHSSKRTTTVTTWEKKKVICLDSLQLSNHIKSPNDLLMPPSECWDCQQLRLHYGKLVQPYKHMSQRRSYFGNEQFTVYCWTARGPIIFFNIYKKDRPQST